MYIEIPRQNIKLTLKKKIFAHTLIGQIELCFASNLSICLIRGGGSECDYGSAAAVCSITQRDKQSIEYWIKYCALRPATGAFLTTLI